MKNMKRAERRHRYQVRKARVERMYSAWDGLNESHRCQLANTTIWKNYERMFESRPVKPSDRRANQSYREQLKEANLEEVCQQQ